MIDLSEEIQLLENTNIKINDNNIEVDGPQGKIEKRFAFPNIEIKKQDNKIQLVSKNASKREKRMINTFKSHIENMIKGVLKGFEYKLKICSSHFPMSVSTENNFVVIKNFLGEKVPRRARILDNVNVKIQGNDVIVTGIDIEKVGQTAANIESACRITNRDRRIFQDGIYIYERE